MIELANKIGDYKSATICLGTKDHDVIINRVDINGVQVYEDHILIHTEQDGEYSLMGNLIYNVDNEIQFELSDGIFLTVELFD